MTKGDPVKYSVVFLLDGSERKNTIPSPTIGRPATEMTSTATWDGDKLVTATWSSSAAAVRKTTRALHLGADGVLFVDTTVTAPPGTTPATSTSTTAYKRTR